MPALSSTSLLNNLATRSATNATSTALQVICAFPVSGQYGPGSRYLYYVLIAACVFARHAEWLRGACLAAALLFPAVAAIHGIVLAALHVPGAVDMDIYGAFQLCSIGILAAPVTVNKSKTYFNDPGRNTIFAWTTLILAGLLSLVVEFFRVKSSDCTQDDEGNPISNNPKLFPYNDYPSCGLVCNITAGPFSPLRQGAANNIYVIPEPKKLTVGTATLLGAACCIPAVLWLVFMWNKILWINWRTRWGGSKEEENPDEVIEGTNDATPEKMRGINSLIRLFLSAVEVPVFGAAVLAIVILGELNFWSPQVSWQTEPIASVGQWAPIAGTALAVLGSLYILLAKPPELEKKDTVQQECNHHCIYSGSGNHPGLISASAHSVATPATEDRHHSFSNGEGSPMEKVPMATPRNNFSNGAKGAHIETVPTVDTHRTFSNEEGRTSLEIVPTTTHPTSEQEKKDAGGRVKVANALAAIGNYLGTPSQDRFDDSDFKHTKARNWPEIPGEAQRNSHLMETKRQYNQYEEDESETEVRPGRAPSIRSFVSGLERSSTTPRAVSPQPSSSPHSAFRMSHASTLPVARRSSELHNTVTSSSAGSNAALHRLRTNTLEVPSPGRSNHTRNPSNSSMSPIIASPLEGPRSPTIVVSSEADLPSPSSPSEPLPTPPLSAP